MGMWDSIGFVIALIAGPALGSGIDHTILRGGTYLRGFFVGGVLSVLLCALFPPLLVGIVLAGILICVSDKLVNNDDDLDYDDEDYDDQ